MFEEGDDWIVEELEDKACFRYDSHFTYQFV